MPELPEVETVRRGLMEHFDGRTLVKVELRREGLRFPFPEGMGPRLEGRKITSIERRAKYLLIRLSGGLTWLTHLGMSGHFSLLRAGEERASLHAYSLGLPVGKGRHDHVVVHLDDGSRVVYTDPRRFGVMDLLDTSAEQEHRLLRHLGPEPLAEEWTAAVLAATLRGKRVKIKTALLDQKVVVGIGNIYACEALFRARISPLCISSTLAGKRRPTKRVELLVTAVKEILAEAIESGGSTLNDFQAVDGELGYFTHFFQVYDRAGQECKRESCTGKITRIVQGGRSTFYCPRCQR
jgi:formamidopyrimidine-DNA glycosylase